MPLTEFKICWIVSFLRLCACNFGFIAVVEGVIFVFVHHVDKEEEVLPEDSGSQTPLASPASADAELASLPMLTLTFTVAEWAARRDAGIARGSKIDVSSFHRGRRSLSIRPWPVSKRRALAGGKRGPQIP